MARPNPDVMPVMSITIFFVYGYIHVRELELESLLGQLGAECLVEVPLKCPEVS